MVYRPQAKRWVFCGQGSVDIVFDGSMDYLIYAEYFKEDSGFRYFEGYIVFKKRERKPKMKDVFGVDVWCEVALTSVAQSVERYYCIRSSHEPGAVVHEYGVMPVENWSRGVSMRKRSHASVFAEYSADELLIIANNKKKREQYFGSF